MGLASNETKHIAKHIARLGLDRSHFIPYRRYTDEDLAEAVRSAQNITGVLRHLGIKVAGGTMLTWLDASRRSD